MKRNLNLIPLSHDHHHGLVLALRLKQSGGDESHEGSSRRESNVPQRWEYAEAKSRTAQWPLKPQEQAKRLVEYFDTEMRFHFAEEEWMVFPVLQKFLATSNTIVDELLDEHVEMEAIVNRLRDGATDSDSLRTLLIRFGELLFLHIRREENELFPLFERVVPREVADRAGEHLREIRKQLGKSNPRLKLERRFRPILTKEHGAWPALIVPFTVGASAARVVDWSIVPLFVSTVFLFMTTAPATILIRAWKAEMLEREDIFEAKLWAFIYASIGLSSGLPLVLSSGYPLLAVFATLSFAGFAVHLLLKRRNPKSPWANLAGVSGLSLAAPAAYYTLRGAIDQAAIVSWIFCLLFFGGTVFYAHMHIDARSQKKQLSPLRDRLRVARLSLWYHSFMFAAVLALVLLRYVSPLVTLAYFPYAIQLLIGTAALNNQISFKKLGITLLAHSLIFAIVLIWALR